MHKVDVNRENMNTIMYTKKKTKKNSHIFRSHFDHISYLRQPKATQFRKERKKYIYIPTNEDYQLRLPQDPPQKIKIASF